MMGSSAGAGAGAGMAGGSVGGKAGAGKGAAGGAGAAVPPGEYKFGFTVYSRSGWGGRDANGAPESV
mgnify:CR=1 FL=1